MEAVAGYPARLKIPNLLRDLPTDTVVAQDGITEPDDKCPGHGWDGWDEGCRHLQPSSLSVLLTV